MSTIRWGILGLGNIARGFAEGIRETEGSVLQAVASRDYVKALAFKDEFDSAIAYGSYEELLRDESVDICYVSVIHPFHYQLAKLCLEHGKPVLLEKPFAMNGHQTRELISMASARNLLLMEAMWTRYNPLIHQLKRWIDEGKIGDVHLLQAQFGYNGGEDHEQRHLNRELGGGALLDIGIYTLSITGLVFGYTPDHITHSVVLDESTSVDRSFTAILKFGQAHAQLAADVVCEYENNARIFGTRGRIEISDPFYNPEEVRFIGIDGSREVLQRNPDVNGFNYEVEEAARCLREGKLESPWQTWAETQQWMDIMDQMRKEWGVQYPGLE